MRRGSTIGLRLSSFGPHRAPLGAETTFWSVGLLTRSREHRVRHRDQAPHPHPRWLPLPLLEGLSVHPFLSNMGFVRAGPRMMGWSSEAS